MELIKLKGVSKEYKKKKVLEDVNLVIEEGDLLGVIGESGSGKTTLLNLITGFIKPSEGDVVYISKQDGAEKNLNKNLHKIKKQIGFAPQHNSFYPKLTVLENMLHFGKLYNLDKQTLVNNINNLLEFTQLTAHKNKAAEDLSGGMQKRLDISCSLLHKPTLLILDEPTADLDPILQKDILHLLQEVNKQGITVVIASHYLDGIEHICNKVAIVHKGKVQKYGSLDEIRKPYLRDHFVITVHSGVEKENLLRRIKALSINKIIDEGNKIIIYPANVEKTTGHLLNIVKEDNLLLRDMDLRKLSLGEIFEQVIQEE